MLYPDTISPQFDERELDDSILPLLAKRWSPRSFKKHIISDKDINTLFEAVRASPSCFNEQPWRFYLSDNSLNEKGNFGTYLDFLVPKNQEWAKNASLVGFIICKQNFTHNDKENAYAEFDSGAAWMSLSIQARAMGLYTHGLGGIEHDKVKEHFKLDDNHKVICGFVIGVADSPENLPDDFREGEKPTERRPLSEMLFR